MEKRIRRIAISVMGVCLWIIYLLESELSGYGIYTFISYQIHELISLLPFILIGITLIWLIILVIRIVKKKNDKEDMLFTAILLIFAVLQGDFIFQSYNTSTNFIRATVENIDSVNGEIEIRNETGQTILLDAPELVRNMVCTDGTEYFITYRFDKTSRLEGKLQMISYARNSDPGHLEAGPCEK